jgi:choloylglycine hydrolase
MCYNFLMKKTIVLALALICALSSFAAACSDFQLKAKDGTVVIGRSMEFPQDLRSRLWVVPRGEKRTSLADKGAAGLSWTAKYAYLAVDGFDESSAVLDGFNEQGLSVGFLMFTGAKYEPAVPGKFVTIADLGAWLLGNFSTVAEVKQALAGINVADLTVKQMGGSLGLHLAVHDAAGQNLVVEFINGEKKVYDNPLGVMTNRPSFDWQLTNLRNYVNLNARDAETKTLNGLKLEPTGVGSGLHGLPGDWTPPSRFVKLAFCVDAALKPKDAAAAVNMAEHLLNSIDIPMGAIKEPTRVPGVDLYGYAQWVVIKDLTNKVIYYKTYENTAWKSIGLKNFDLNAAAARRSIVMADKELKIIDVSGQLR